MALNRHQLGTRISLHNGIMSAVKRIEFGNDKVSQRNNTIVGKLANNFTVGVLATHCSNIKNSNFLASLPK
jgi:hypothetical protein